MTTKGGFVQKLITSYFSEVSSGESVSSDCTELSSPNSIDRHPIVSETPQSKIGNLPWYLGSTARIRSSQPPNKATLGSVATSKHSPTSSCASVTGTRKLF